MLQMLFDKNKNEWENHEYLNLKNNHKKTNNIWNSDLRRDLFHKQHTSLAFSFVSLEIFSFLFAS